MMDWVRSSLSLAVIHATRAETNSAIVKYSFVIGTIRIVFSLFE